MVRNLIAAHRNNKKWELQALSGLCVSWNFTLIFLSKSLRALTWQGPLVSTTIMSRSSPYRELLVQSKFTGEQMKLEWQQLFEHHRLWSKQDSRKVNMWYLQRKAINNSLHYCMPQEIVYHLLLLSLMLECMMLWWSMHQKEALVWPITQQVAGRWVLYC